MKQKNSYIDKKQFYEAMVEWKLSGNPAVPDGIARNIMLICTELAKSWQFAGYTENWKKDMIGDAIFNCIKYAGHFNPEKSNNAFSYFTTIAYNAFIHRLNTEKKQLDITEKYKRYASVHLFDSLTVEEREAFDYLNENARNFDMNIKKGKETSQPKKKRKKSVLEELLDEE